MDTVESQILRIIQVEANRQREQGLPLIMPSNPHAEYLVRAAMAYNHLLDMPPGAIRIMAEQSANYQNTRCARALTAEMSHCPARCFLE